MAIDRVKRRHEKERKARRRQVFTAAMKLFSKKGYHATSMEEIAQKAELAKGTIYLYFRNKSGLFSALVEEAIQQAARDIEQVEKSKGEFIPKLNKLVTTFLKIHARSRFFLQIWPRGEWIPEPQFKQSLRAAKTQYFKIIQVTHQILLEGMRQKILRQVAVRKASCILLGMIHALTIGQLEEKSDTKKIGRAATVSADEVVRFFLEGMRNPKQLEEKDYGTRNCR